MYLFNKFFIPVGKNYDKSNEINSFFKPIPFVSNVGSDQLTQALIPPVAGSRRRIAAFQA